MRNQLKRFWAFVLIVSMVVTMLPMGSLINEQKVKAETSIDTLVEKIVEDETSTVQETIIEEPVTSDVIETTTIEVENELDTETTYIGEDTTELNNDYTILPDDTWTDISDDWSVYAGSWSGASVGYKGSMDEDLSLKILSSSGNAGEWGIQVKRLGSMESAELIEGEKYKLLLNYNSTSSGEILVKLSEEYSGFYQTHIGENCVELEFVYTSDIQCIGITENGIVLMELSGLPAGTILSEFSFSYELMEEIEETTSMNDGYTVLPDVLWTSISDDWSLYAGSWSEASIGYKGSIDEDLSLKILSTNGNAGGWGIQVARLGSMENAGLKERNKYKLILNYNSTSSGEILVKLSDDYTSFFETDVGENQVEIEFVYTSNINPGIDENGAVLMELSGLPAGTIVSDFSFTYEFIEEVTTEEPTTVIPPEKVSNLNAIGEIGKISLSWSKAIEVTCNKYRVYRRIQGETEYKLLKEIVGREVLSYEDTNVQDGVIYEYSITCVNDSGVESEKSEFVSAETTLDTEAPIIIKIYPSNMSVLTGIVNFSASVHDNCGVNKIVYSYSIDDGMSWRPIIDDTEEYLDSNLNNSTSQINVDYLTASLDTTTLNVTNIKVKAYAVDFYGNISSDMTYSYVIDNEGPDKVIGLSDTTYTSVTTLIWNDVEATDKHHFMLQELIDGEYITISNYISELGYIIKGLSPESIYTYRVACVDKYGNVGEWSEDYTIKTTVDENVPVITNLSPAPGRYNKSITFTATAKDDCIISTIIIQTSTDLNEWIEIDRKEFSANSNSCTYSTTVALNTYDEGSVYVRAIAKDSSGNMSVNDNTAPYIEYIVDKTPPETPKNIRAKGNEGYIEITWDDVSDNYRDRYFVYRSDSEDGAYVKVVSELNKLNYIDRNVSSGNAYYYKISVDDTCGNMSDLSNCVSAQVNEDIEVPIIQSIGPENGEKLSKTYPQVKVLAVDNCKLSTVLVEYKVNDGEYLVLTNTNNINNYYKNVTATVPIDILEDGDTITVRISATDESGNQSAYEIREYSIDKIAPIITNLKSNIEENCITVTWSDIISEDLSGHKIYRSINDGSYALVATRAASEASSYEYKESVSRGGTYKYKIVTYDRLYNSSYKITEEMEYVEVEVNESPIARISANSFMEVGVEEYFDASSSSDDENIVEYIWDFGDGTSSNEIRPVKKYIEKGKYTVSLTVVDNQGIKGTATTQIEVKEKEALGALVIKVQDVDGNAVPFADIYIDLGSENQKILYTDANGQLTLKLSMGTHLIGMYENGYLPIKTNVNVLVNTTRNVTMETTKQDIVTGEFEIQPMDFDEIKAAGIDVNDPANYQTYKANVKVTYGTTSFEIGYIRNDTEIIKTDIPNYTFTTSSGEERKIGGVIYIPVSSGRTNTDSDNDDDGDDETSDGGTNIGSRTDNEIVAIVDIPAKATFLKEFFDVRLHIINNASAEFKLINNEITLNVPDGMTLMSNLNGTYSENNVVYIPEIVGQEQKTISWVLRGDKSGEYDLSANFIGELEEFGAPISAIFKTNEDEKIKVYGLDGIEFSVEPDEKLYEGAMYFNIGLKNERDININLPTIDLDETVVSSILNEKNSGNVDEGIKVNLLKVYVENEDGSIKYYDVDYDGGGTLTDIIEVLEPNQRLVHQYIAYNIADSDDTAYLQDCVITSFEGMKENIVVQSSSVNEYEGELLKKLSSDTNFAKGKESFSSSTSLDIFEANQAFDGSIGTRWMAENNSDGQHVGVDIGTEVAIDEIIIAWEKAYAGSYTIYTSLDGEDYKVVAELTSNANELKSIPIATTKARYVKVVCNENPLPYGTSIWEIGVYGQAVSEEIIEVERVVEIEPKNEDLDQIEKAVKYQMGLVLKKKELLDSTDVGVPPVELGGFNLNLFNLEAKVGMNLDKLNWNAAVDTETKTILVKIGYKDEEGAKIVQTTDMCSATWSTQYKEMKKFYKFISGANLKTRKNWNDFQKMKASLNKMGCDLFLSADCSIGGYLEFDYSTGIIAFSEGGLVASAGIGTEFKFPLVAFPSIYTALGLKGNIDGSITVKKESIDIINTELNFEPSITATAKIEATIGLASAEAGVDATLAAKISNSENPLVVTMSGNIFANVRLLTKEWPFSKPYVNAQLYPSETSTLSLYEGEINAESARDISRSYITESNAEYPYNDVKVVSLSDGRQVMMWVGDDTSKTDINRTVLKYKIYEDGKWSNENTLANDGTAIGDFKICESQDRVYVVYQKANKIYEDNVSVEDMLKNIDLQLQIFDGSDFSEPISVKTDSNDVYEVIKNIEVVDDKVNIVWAENTENEIFVGNGLTKVYTRSYYNGVWNSKTEVSSSSTEINNNFISEVVTNDEDEMYYTKYIGETSSYILISEINGSKKTIEQGDNISNLQMIDGVLYFIKDKTLYSYENLKLNEENITYIDNFKIVTNGLKKILVTNVSVENGSQIYTSNHDGEQWSDMKLFAITETYIRNYSPTMKVNGELQITVNSVSLEEGYYGDASILILEKQEKYDLEVTNIYHNEDEIIPGSELTISVDVANNSTVVANNVTVYVKSFDEVLCKSIVDNAMESGTTNTYSLTYRLPIDFKKKNITIEVKSDLQETDYENNVMSEYLGYANLEVSELQITEDENHNFIASATVQNIGHEKAEEVSVLVYGDGSKEKLVDTVSIEDIGINEKISFEWIINEDLYTTLTEDVYNALIFEIKTATEEVDFANNDAKIVYETLVRTYDIIIDGNVVSRIEEGDTYTLGTAEYGYYSEGTMYPPNYEYTVEHDVEFTSINEVQVDFEYGASIRIDGTSGIRFKANITSDNMNAISDQECIVQGMLVTTNDIYEESNEELRLDSKHEKIQIVNSGWYNNIVGSYCGSIINIQKDNYIRPFIARAYVQIPYADGSVKTIYSDMSSVRSISKVANAVRNAGYPGINESYKSVIDKYADAE